MEMVRPYLQEFVLGNARLDADRARGREGHGALSAVTLPEDLRKYLTRAMRGELEVKVSGLSDGARLVYAAVRQLDLRGAGIAASIAALALHLHRSEEPRAIAMYVAAGFAGLFSCLSASSRGRAAAERLAVRARARCPRDLFRLLGFVRPERDRAHHRVTAAAVAPTNLRDVVRRSLAAPRVVAHREFAARSSRGDHHRVHALRETARRSRIFPRHRSPSSVRST